MLLILPRIGIFRLLARLKKKNETISQVVDIVEKKVVDFWVIMTDNSIQEVGDEGRKGERVSIGIVQRIRRLSCFRSSSLYHPSGCQVGPIVEQSAKQ